MAVCQNLVPLVNIKIAGKWMFIPLKMVLIGIDPYPNQDQAYSSILQLIFPAFSSVSPFFSGTSGEVIPPPTKKNNQRIHHQHLHSLHRTSRPRRGRETVTYQLFGLLPKRHRSGDFQEKITRFDYGQ